MQLKSTIMTGRSMRTTRWVVIRTQVTLLTMITTMAITTPTIITFQTMTITQIITMNPIITNRQTTTRKTITHQTIMNMDTAILGLQSFHLLSTKTTVTIIMTSTKLAVTTRAIIATIATPTIMCA